MEINRKLILLELRDVLLLIVMGFLMTILFGYYQSMSQFLRVGSFSAGMWILLWKGNSYLSDILGLRSSWFDRPVRTFFVGILATIIYSAGSIYLLVKIFEWAIGMNFGNITMMLYSSVTVTILISFFMHGRAFLLGWKQSAIDTEKLKRESMSARYESLKNQVNPHFLFNSLNALTNLVYENQDLAVKFIKQLSEVYRYVLDTRERELVSEQEELKFLDSYIFLQRIRFGDNLRIEMKMDGEPASFPPLVLQMLIENAIKHNEISADNPLSIKLYKEGEYVVVENNLQLKTSVNPDSQGVGLSNIISRYEFLSTRRVEVLKDERKFVVRLPILKPEP